MSKYYTPVYNLVYRISDKKPRVCPLFKISAQIHIRTIFNIAANFQIRADFAAPVA